jgi:hypothetical protein
MHTLGVTQGYIYQGFYKRIEPFQTFIGNERKDRQKSNLHSWKQ